MNQPNSLGPTEKIGMSTGHAANHRGPGKKPIRGSGRIKKTGIFIASSDNAKVFPTRVVFCSIPMNKAGVKPALFLFRTEKD